MSPGILTRGFWMARPAFATAALLAVLLGAGCAALGGEPPTDARYGHRYGAVGPDGRETLLLVAPADSSAFFLYPAVIDSVGVRPERRAVAEGAETAVEVLVKGALPDACSELSGLTQTRAGHIVTMALTMRQPRRPVCAQVVRPFRFYVLLDGTYGAGAYTLLLNDAPHPFQILEARTER